MRILFFVLSAFLLSACSQQGFTSVFNSLTGNFSESSLKDECEVFPYDNSDSACNLYGWQTFAYQSLAHTKAEHQQALTALGELNGDTYKRLILLSQHHETVNVRLKATDTLFAIAKANDNSFGHFFYILATHNKQDLVNKKNAIYLNAKLKKQTQTSAKLKAELISAQAKIEAIMDIEKTLNTN
ncbi:hypothetical protein [Psychromonas algicola]|uniref:hypothetical protein n=1 Tax=Psychromonas algicola TaxID=2555642 RepID=UPI0010673B93|nr:hypothetical protein [Psychromonas sp. RZ5]TEW44294.1 hypothetical protein E2R67_14980 [Psychromonas sp. RZ5]